MDFQETLKTIESSNEFKKFKKEEENAYLCAAFFVFDYESKEEKRQLDYFISENNIMTFSINQGKVIPMKAETTKRDKITAIDIKEIKVSENEAIEMAKEKSLIGKDFTKVIAILHNIEGKLVWNLSCFKGLQMMMLHISASDKKIHKKEKVNLMDMMKIERGRTPDYIQ